MKKKKINKKYKMTEAKPKLSIPVEETLQHLFYINCL